MKEAVMIQRMEYQDLPSVAELERKSFTVAWSEKLIEECLYSSLDKVWLLWIREGAEAGNVTEAQRLIGYCIFRVIAGEGELMRIAVDRDYRGHGYARKLMEILVSDVRENQVQEVTLEVRASNLSAINLYKDYGFQIEAVRRAYYTNPQEDALIMWRRKF